MAGEVVRLAPWLHAEDIVEAAGWLAAEPLTLRGAPLRRLLRELESTDQHFLTDAMASEAWILQTRDKLAPGVAETAVAELLASAATLAAMEPQALIDTLWQLVTARVPGLLSVAVALGTAPGPVFERFSAEQFVHLASAFLNLGQEPRLASRLAAAAQPALRQLEASLLARLCAALTSLGCTDATFALAAATTTAAQAVDFETNDLVMAVCAQAELGGLNDNSNNNSDNNNNNDKNNSNNNSNNNNNIGTDCAMRLAQEVQERASIGALHGGDAARLACAFSLAGVQGGDLYSSLCFALPFQYADQLRLDCPVLVINLDRSPERLSAMAGEMTNAGVLAGVVASRFVAIDGRHRVLGENKDELRSSGEDNSWLHDLPSFELAWNEPRPTLGLALTAQSERHFVGYVGSYLSHRAAARLALEDEGYPFVVILEDDQTLHPDFNNVVADIAERAGALFDIINLGPLDWRFRTLEYAQRRKVMSLDVPEPNYFLYWLGASDSDPAWGYMVSRSYDDQMQAALNGGSSNGLTADQVGDDLDMGRPHASFRDGTLLHPMAKVILGPSSFQPMRSDGGLTTEALLKVSAMALAWPPLSPEWVNSPRGWRSLFEYRRGSSSELQKELQIRLRLQPETLALATESLAYSWTVIAALRNFGLSSLFGPGGRGDSSSASRRRPLRVLLLGAGERTSFCPRALFRDLAALVPGDEPQNNNSNNNNQVHVILAGFEDAQENNNNNNNRGHHFQATEPEEVEALRCFRVPEDGRLSVERLTWKDLQKRWWAKPVAEASHNNHNNNDNNIDRDAAPDIAVVVGLPEHMWSRVLPSLLQNGLPTVVTASNQGTLETGLQSLCRSSPQLAPRCVFGGRNPFGSVLGRNDHNNDNNNTKSECQESPDAEKSPLGLHLQLPDAQPD
ncbi:unnamed protein product, partial [Polarella glacialis]